MITDTIKVTDYLRDLFGHDKLLLLGHSWGSYLGIQVVAATITIVDGGLIASALSTM